MTAHAGSRRRSLRLASVLLLALVVALLGALSVPADADAATGSLVSVGSPATVTPANHQDEPAVAVDANHPNVLVAGANDNVDQPVCPQDLMAVNGRCNAFVAPAGLSGVYFSFDAGHTWVQPQYTGWTGRNCPPVSTCPGEFGPIGTLPWYYESGLISDGDPAVAVGPKPGPNGFSWENGSRVYYANLAAPTQFSFPNKTFRGLEALAVSRLDDPTPTRVQEKSSWLPPVIVNTRSSQTVFEDKDQIWADNAASSPFFGHVYVCAPQARAMVEGKAVHGQGPIPAPLEVSVSTDGGATWATKQLTAASTAGGGPTQWGLTGCTVRTTSKGVVHLFAEMTEPATTPPTHVSHVVFTSTDGGASWSKPQVLFRATDACFFVDPVSHRCVMDGYAGARTEMSTAPSVDIANGAPTGAGATDVIVDAWIEGTLDAEKVMVAWGRNGVWSAPAPVSLPGDRPMYAAPAISPVGDKAYVVYEAVTSPWRGADMSSPRPYHGVLLTAPVPATGTPAWSLASVGPTGDLRGTYPGHDIYQERIGDYVYAAATRTYGVGLYTDASNAAVCPAVQEYRAASLAAGTRALPSPYPPTNCPPTFGNTDIVALATG